MLFNYNTMKANRNRTKKITASLLLICMLFLTACKAAGLPPHRGKISKEDFYDNYVYAAEAIEIVATDDMTYAKYYDIRNSDTFSLVYRNDRVLGFSCEDYVYYNSAWSDKMFARLVTGIADLYLSQPEGTLQGLQDLVYTDLSEVWEYPYLPHDIESSGIHFVSELEEMEDGAIIHFTVMYA